VIGELGDDGGPSATEGENCSAGTTLFLPPCDQPYAPPDAIWVWH